jgi:diguanylate cyclase (GGDEF)-like protein/PAS domain S-box-containing protein
MENHSSADYGQVSPADWNRTPDSVRQWIAVLQQECANCLERESRLLQFLDAAPIGIAAYDATGQLVYINSSGRRVLGQDNDTNEDTHKLENSPAPPLEASPIYRAGTQIRYPVEQLPTTQALRGVAAAADDLEVRWGDRTIFLEVQATPIFDAQGNVTYAIATLQDISPQKRRNIEQQIIENTRMQSDRRSDQQSERQSDQRYRQVIQAQTDLILRSTPDTRITFASDSLCATLGLPLEEVVGQRWSSFVPTEDLDAIYRKIAALTPTHPTFENINRDQRPNHQIGWTQWVNVGIFDEQGVLVEIQSVGRDITELQTQIQREQALNHVFQAIRNSLDLDTIFATATAETARLLQDLDCYVVQYLPKQGVWKHVAAYRHDAAQPSTLGLEISDAGNPFASRLKQFQVVQVNDATVVEDTINRDLAQIVPGAWLLIPLSVDGKLWGSFTIVANGRSLLWSEDQVQLVQAVAHQLEIAIQQANLYQQAQIELTERRRIEAALRESEARFQNMAANVPGAIFQYLLRPDGSDAVVYMSPGCLRLWEVDAQAVVEDATVLWQMIEPEDLPAMQASVMESARTLQPWSWAWRITTPSGRKKWLEAAGRPTRYANGDIIWDTLILDVTERQTALAQLQQSELALRDSEARYRLLAENTSDLVCLHQPSGHYSYVSPSCEGLLGYRYDEMLGRLPQQFVHPEEGNRLAQALEIAANSGKAGPVTYRMRHRAGHYAWFETLIKSIVDETGTVVQLQTTSRDVTERVRIQRQLEYAAVHDALTGLPNRKLLMERLEAAIARAKSAGDYQFAVIFLDLDRFKVINDSLGHLAGDQLLIAIAQILQSTLKPSDLAARLGGDEFIILLEEIPQIQAAIDATAELFLALQTPLLLEGREIYTTASAGIVLGTSAYDQASHLLRDADIAMYRAKQKGKACYEIFDLQMHAQALRRLHLENDLRQAIAAEEFVLHYQPTVDLNTGALVGFESLIRWQHPTQGLKFPADFITTAEEIGLITAIDLWALQTACRQLASWQQVFPQCSQMKVGVNLSVQDLKYGELIDEIDRALERSSLNPACLMLEITESMLVEDAEAAIRLLEQIKARGIHISIDDFGTGYSSLSYLHRLPVDSLKVDRSFVSQIEADPRNHQIVETIAALSQQLGLGAIAEGIETHTQREQLLHLGYQLGQGYLFSRALTSEAAAALLAQETNLLDNQPGEA